MKKFIPLFALIGIVSGFFFACTSTPVSPNSSGYNTATQYKLDSATLDTFIAHHPVIGGIPVKNVIKLSSGLRYIIVADTAKDTVKNPRPTNFSNVTFSYSIRVPGAAGVSGTNGLVDSIPSVLNTVGYNVNPLGNTIQGLVQGLKLIHQKGHILLFIPSILGFQNQSVNLSYLQGNQTTILYTVPINSDLIYNVNLTSVLSY